LAAPLLSLYRALRTRPERNWGGPEPHAPSLHPKAMAFRLWRTAMLASALMRVVSAQTKEPDLHNNATQPIARPTDNLSEEAPKRVLGIIPNYRTSPSLKNYKPLTPGEKFKMASQDSFDRGAFVLGALFGGEAQLTKATPSFGQGVAGYARYFSTSYAGFVVGNFMTEGIYPTLLHQDPRYFRRGSGSVLSRLGYAAGQIFWTHKDSGGMQFNFSEIAGNSTAVAISNAYLPDNRDASDAARSLGVQIGVDMAGNILKEFSPELAHAFSRKRHSKEDGGAPKQ